MSDFLCFPEDGKERIDILKDYSFHNQIPDTLLKFLQQEAQRLALLNLYESDRGIEEKRKGAVLLIMDLVNLHNDLNLMLKTGGIDDAPGRW